MHHDDRARIKTRTQRSIDAATEQLEGGAISRGEWQRRVAQALSDAYLSETDPRWQSGFDGDAVLWREARSLVLLAAPTTGAFLDVGCANGHLIESLAVWSPERGQRLEFFGLELDPALAAEARRRLPALADHIFVGNISDWMPPRRFSCVRTGLEYVPPGEEPALLERIASHLLEAGGRVLVGPVNDDAVEVTQKAFSAARLPPTEIVSATDHRGKTRHVVWSAV
jgi:SAM-dependent methyltransferase